METFLQLVARDLYAKIGNDLSRTAIVFPNKRASLFFNEYLAAETDRPLWSPAYVSISELFRCGFKNNLFTHLFQILSPSPFSLPLPKDEAHSYCQKNR